MDKSNYVNKAWKAYVEYDRGSVSLDFYNSDYTTIKRVGLQSGAINKIPALTDDEWSQITNMAFSVPKGVHLTLTQVPNYRGAIVSDGVDDYGRCIKDFALPDDYTVVAMRERIFKDVSYILGKNIGSGQPGAFNFESGIPNVSSYGRDTPTSSVPVLFSYQSKSSYNGTPINYGNAVDTNDAKLCVFRSHMEHNSFAKAALYSFGIFTRTLTEEELRIVENCMYAEWICMTGKLEDIEYYDILDARFRSNEEDADKRNKWVGRLGKLHMTLNNYAYSEMSGWDGWPIDWESWNNVVIPQQGGLVEVSKSIIKVKNFGAQPTWTITSNSEIASIPEMRIKISGLKTGASLFFIKQVSDSTTNLMTATGDGIYTVPADSSAPEYYGIHCNGYSANEDADLTIELLPDYGGALVSDGVDDYAVSDEVIDEPIGGVVAHAEILPSNTGYIFSTNWKSDGIFEYSSLAYRIAGDIVSGNEQVDTKNVSLDTVIRAFGRVPAIPAGKLFIGTINETLQQMGKTALYQLRLIKNQPTDVQLEAIKWQCRKEHDDYLIHMGWKDETPAWYGIEWDVTDPSPDVKRIGNMQMHRDLPVQSQMRGCLIDDNGVVQKYLNPDDWTSETLDGSAGQVMVHAPIDSYWRFEKDGNIRRVKLATTALPGFKRTPQGFISAHEATVQRSMNKLCSVVNTDPDYRGGSNKAEWDGTYRSLLGMPATSINRTNFRTYARNRKPGGTEWNCMTYDFQKLLYWLFVVEYATLNTQKPVNTEKDANGFSQGGLGNGMTTWNWTAWSNHNSNHPFIPCGVTNKLGNNSGEVAFQITLSDDSTREFKVARYRGVENPFGHVWQWTDGLNLRISANTSAGGDGLSRIFTCSDPAKFSDTGYDGYKYIGDAPRAEGYMKDIVFGEDGDIVPISTGGSSTTYFCDYWYTAIPDSGESLRGVLFGGYASYGAYAGLAYAGSSNAPSSAFAYFGSRLCFIPA